MTIIATLHNSGSLVYQLLQRLSLHRDEGHEIVLVDDGSTDGTADRLREYADRCSGVKLIASAESHGVARARSLGLSEARGDFVWFVDDDDAWDPTIVSQFLRAARESGADIVVCRADLRRTEGGVGTVIDGIDADIVVSRDDAWSLLLAGKLNGYLWNKMIKRTLLGADPFERLSSQSDFTGVARAVARCRSVRFIPGILYFHMVREGSITRSRDPKLQNLQRAHDVALELHSGPMNQSLESAAVSFFTAWFLVLPLGNTPTRVGANWSTRFDGLTLARQVTRGLLMADVRAYSWRVYVTVLLMTKFGVPYLLALDFAHRVRRLGRMIGERK
ncbi:glycosyltransferase family 2 protein [Microbacterium sp. CCNWLW134]|uniref:glycosyltransferase family 2 protein n=1 Tax=Microbacterium sp. CCNWLW134 TaxID=3122064 RepID=UPI00300FD2B7